MGITCYYTSCSRDSLPSCVQRYRDFRGLVQLGMCLIVRVNSAGLVDRFNVSFPSLKDGFDSRIPLHRSPP